MPSSKLTTIRIYIHIIIIDVRCPDCNSAMAPRGLPQEEVVEIIQKGVQFAMNSKLPVRLKTIMYNKINELLLFRKF
jgi:hypothetical protein